MDSAHLHLISNHIPILGTAFGLFVLLLGMITRNSQTRIAAYLLLAIASIGGFIAFNTGEGAEDAVERITGVAETAIHDHEEAAELSIYLIGAMGLLAAAGIFIELKAQKFAKTLSLLMIGAGLVCLVLAVRTGYIGGQIRHTEISGQQVSERDNGGEKADDD